MRAGTTLCLKVENHSAFRNAWSEYMRWHLREAIPAVSRRVVPRAPSRGPGHTTPVMSVKISRETYISYC